MNRNKIILFSGLIIAIFALLYHLENPGPGVDCEVREFTRQYEGKQGFAIVKMPDFLMGEVLPDSSAFHIGKENFKSFRVMIFHQNENQQYNCKETEKALQGFLDSLQFRQVIEQQSDTARMMRVYEKEKAGPWKENVTLYTSDSTLFMFNYISNLNRDKLVAFSNQLGYQDFF
jgi:hypothetical protein